ncbi:LysR family transcriptional regulator, partial [Ralstonia pickettii]|nr:LysR family transcriptional regulator [Ralstonia pickettii]
MLDYALLDALAAVIRHGSFERAAKELNVTPSAVSQRVKLLEERVGSVLVKRGQPCVATTSGALLCRHTERVQLLEAELGGRMPALPGQIAS